MSVKGVLKICIGFSFFLVKNVVYLHGDGMRL